MGSEIFSLCSWAPAHSGEITGFTCGTPTCTGQTSALPSSVFTCFISCRRFCLASACTGSSGRVRTCPEQAACSACLASLAGLPGNKCLEANSRHTSVGVAHLVGINSGQLPPEIASLDPEADPKGAPFSLRIKAADLADLWRQSDGLGCRLTSQGAASRLPRLGQVALLLPGCLDWARFLCCCQAASTGPGRSAATACSTGPGRCRLTGPGRSAASRLLPLALLGQAAAA